MRVGIPLPSVLLLLGGIILSTTGGRSLLECNIGRVNFSLEFLCNSNVRSSYLQSKNSLPQLKHSIVCIMLLS